jgi:hypothetical protein
LTLLKARVTSVRCSDDKETFGVSLIAPVVFGALPVADPAAVPLEVLPAADPVPPVVAPVDVPAPPPLCILGAAPPWVWVPDVPPDEAPGDVVIAPPDVPPEVPPDVPPLV